jgi:cytochrome d ubiquinol oxidase subunit II
MTFYQEIWFILIAFLLIGYAILDGFDLGAGFWHLAAEKGKERTAIVNTVLPYWDGNEVWLITGGGALFAAFPAVYATVFSGFYLALMLVLLGLILRASALEFRDKVESPAWMKVWDVAFSVGSILPALLFGVAVGNLVKGLALDAQGNYTGTFGELLSPYSLMAGITGLFMFATHGALYLAMKTSGALANKARGWAQKVFWIFAGCYAVSAVWSLMSYNRNGSVAAWILAALVLAELGVMRRFTAMKKDTAAFLASCTAIATICAAVGFTLFPHMIPATNDFGLSLTVYSSSSSELTLKVMLIMALIGMPLVIGYTAYIFKVFAAKKAAQKAPAGKEVGERV